MGDRVLVYGQTPTEHDQRLQAVLNLVLQAAMSFKQLNVDKCEFSKVVSIFGTDCGWCKNSSLPRQVGNSEDRGAEEHYGALMVPRNSKPGGQS